MTYLNYTSLLNASIVDCSCKKNAANSGRKR